MDERRKEIEGRLRQIFSEAVPAPATKTAPKRRKNTVGSVVGETIAVGDNNVIVIHQGPLRPKIVATIEPGVDHISDAQAATLNDLVSQVVEITGKVKRRPITFQAVWGSLNAHCKVPGYRLIRLTDYPKAEKYLRAWIGRLTAAKSAPKKLGDDLRKRQYAYIHLNAKQLRLQTKLKQLLETAYEVESLTELSDEDLKRVYQRMAGWKRAALKDKTRG